MSKDLRQTQHSKDPKVPKVRDLWTTSSFRKYYISIIRITNTISYVPLVCARYCSKTFMCISQLILTITPIKKVCNSILFDLQMRKWRHGATLPKVMITKQGARICATAVWLQHSHCCRYWDYGSKQETQPALMLLQVIRIDQH